MAEQELWLESRTETGKEFAGKIRRTGKVPGVVYGRGKEPRAVLIDTAQVLKILHSPAGRNTILTLKSDDQELAGRRAVIRQGQSDAITEQLLHVDLMEVVKDRPVRVWLPVEVLGRPVGVEKGGTLEEHMREIEISCLPDEIPEHIKIEVSQLDVGDSIHVRDLKLEKAKILSNPVMTVVSVVAAKAEEVAAPVAAVAEGEAVPAEGEAAAAPAEGEAAAEPGKPGEKVAAGKPGEKAAGKPGEKAAAKPGEKAPAKPAEKVGGRPAAESKGREKKSK